MEKKEMTLEEKYAYAIKALQAISTRNPYTENNDIESDWDNHYTSKAFYECKQCAQTALKTLGEPELLPNYNGGYKARQNRYAAKHENNIKKRVVKIEDALNEYKERKIREAMTIFKENFKPWIRIDCHVVGQCLLCIEPFENMTFEDCIVKDIRSEYSFASQFLKENILTNEKLKFVGDFLNKNYVFRFMDDPILKSNIQKEATEFMQSYLHEYELQHPGCPLWLMAYGYYQNKMRGEV